MKTRFRIYKMDGQRMEQLGVRRWDRSMVSLGSFANSYRSRFGRLGVRMGCFCEIG